MTHKRTMVQLGIRPTPNPSAREGNHIILSVSEGTRHPQGMPLRGQGTPCPYNLTTLTPYFLTPQIKKDATM